ncbi:MAG TPA: transposase [Acidobacteriota bacterium]|nr:transposase [Acidobacteriota bacterium]
MRRRRPIRLQGYDYSLPGYYFVTICTKDRKPCLASIVDGKSILSPTGTIVERCWRRLQSSFPGLLIDALILMPDHLHGILSIPERTAAQRKYSLAALIQSFKSVSSRKVGCGAGTLWQRAYYDRVIRTERELNMTRLYMEMNPRLWDTGCDLNETDISEDAIQRILSKYPAGKTW